MALVFSYAELFPHTTSQDSCDNMSIELWQRVHCVHSHEDLCTVRIKRFYKYDIIKFN